MEYIKTSTIEYYDTNATSYAMDTVNADMSHMRNLFMSYVPCGSMLDLGCGSGRDSKFFLEAGYSVTAIDGSNELCKIAAENTGLNVICKTFEMIDFEDEFDGIWACSSLLHLDKKTLQNVFIRIKNALKNNGYLYASFKYGDFTGDRNGRFFTDLTEESLLKILSEIPELQVVEFCITNDVRPGREHEKWLNAFVKKNDI